MTQEERDALIDDVAKAISGAPFPSSKSQKKALLALAIIEPIIRRDEGRDCAAVARSIFPRGSSACELAAQAIEARYR